MLQNPNFDPAERAYSAPPEPLADGRGLAAPMALLFLQRDMVLTKLTSVKTS